MAIRREIILVFLLLVAIAVVVKLVEIYNGSFGENADASKFVLEDLNSKYPGAAVSIMSITPMSSPSGSQYLEVKTSVTQDPDTPCPRLSHIFYNYPVQNFVPQPPEIITSGCHVCTEGICNIAFPEEAIIASHTLPGTDAVSSFLAAEHDAVPGVTERTDSWLVEWDSPSSPTYLQVEVGNNGTIMNVASLTRS